MARLFWILLLAVTLWALFSAVAFAQVELIALSPEQRAEPGDFVTVAFEITNRGASPDTFGFELAVPEGLSPLATPGPLTLGPGASEQLFITLSVSAQAEAGENRVILAARSTTDPTIATEATALIIVEEVPGIRLVPPADRDVEPGKVVTLPFEVINEGNALDRLALSAESLRGFPLKLEPQALELLPGETRSVEVRLSVPEEADAGRERVTLVARSTVFGVEASATVTLTVLPPLPEEVPTELFLEVPSTLKLSVLGVASSPAEVVGSLDGATTFAQAGEIAYRFTVTGLTEVRKMRFHLERAQFGTTVGDLELELARLLKLRGRGARLMLREAPDRARAVTLAAARGAGDGLALGTRGAFEVGGMIPIVGARFRPAREEAVVASGLSAKLSDLGEVSMEGAWSRDAATSDRAVLVRSETEVGDLEIDGELIRAGSDFLGDRSDVLGFSLKQSLDRAGISVRSLFRRARDNVAADPGRPTTVETRARATARLPLGRLPTLSAQFDFRSRSNPVPPFLTDLRTFGTEFRLSQEVGPLTLSATVDRRRARDLVAGTDLERVRLSSDADLRIDPLLTIFQVEHTIRRDLVSGILIDRSLITSVSTRLRLTPLDLRFSVERFPGATVLGARIGVELGRFAVTSTKSVRIRDTGEVGFEFDVSAVLGFDAPIPFIETKGRLEGFVFVDDNDNGQRDPEELGVSDLILSLGRVRARTDAEGFYRFPPLEPGMYPLDIENLPAELISRLPLPREVNLQAGEVERADIPVARVSTIRGVVFNDANEDGARDLEERGLADVRVLAVGLEGDRRRATTGSDGAFQFAGLTPGRWRVAVDEATLPEDFQLTTAQEVPVELGAGEVVDVAFGAVERPPEVKFSPTADFTFTPEVPVAGEPVTFDGSASNDPDGEIVTFEWDFDGDGKTDATGETATFTFEVPGRFEVTLTVTDDDGQTGSETQTVTVSAP